MPDETPFLDEAPILEFGKCCFCDKMGRVGLIPDPYALDLYNEEDWGWYHEECARKSWLET